MTNTAKIVADKITGDTDAWDKRELGADEEFVRVSTQGSEKRIDEGLGLQMVSMRLPKEAVDQLKALAREQGLGYQPLVRQILMKYLKEHR